MRSFNRFTVLAIILAAFLAPVSQIQAQNPCGACLPKDTTAIALNAFKAKMGGMDKDQNARIASLQVSRVQTQKSIEVLSNKVLDLNAKSATDTSVVNQLARNSAELARQKLELAKIESELSGLNRQLAEARAKALEQANKDTKKKTSGMSTGDKWLIGGSAVAVTAGLVYLAVKNLGGSEIHTSSSSSSCSGNNCR